MKNHLYHQLKNTQTTLITYFPYDYNHWEFNCAHFHKNYEILIAVRGEFDCFIDNNHYDLKQGDAILIQPFQIHGLHVKKGSLVACSTFAERFFPGIAGALEGKRAKHPVFHPDDMVTQFFVSQLERYIGKRIEIPSEKLTKLQETVFKGLAYSIGSVFLEQVELMPSPKNQDALIVSLVKYIDENFKSDITLYSIAKHFGYNYQYISKVFNKTFNISFKQFLIKYRLEYALYLLEETNDAIYQIAFKSGFQSMRSFDYACRVFYNKSAKEIRKELKNNK